MDRNWLRKVKCKEREEKERTRKEKERKQKLKNEKATREHEKRHLWILHSVQLPVLRRIKVKRNRLMDQVKRKYYQRSVDEEQVITPSLAASG